MMIALARTLLSTHDYMIARWLILNRCTSWDTVFTESRKTSRSCLILDAINPKTFYYFVEITI